jgi:hypothetical protein
MKKKFLLGMFSILLALGLVMTGCDFSFLDELSGGSNSSNGSSSGNNSNLFAGTSWRATDGGYTWTLSFTSSSWTLRGSDGESESGSYTYSGNTATCRQGGDTLLTATISGNTLNVVDYESNRLTFTKGSTGSSDDSSPNNNSSPGDSSGSADGEIPTKPKNLKVIPDTESTMKLEWSKGSYDDDVTGYNIYRSSGTQYESSGSFTKVGTSTSRDFTDTGLSPDTWYYYQITAYNDSGEGPKSSEEKYLTAVLAGTTRETATKLNFDYSQNKSKSRIYYFPPDADELWFYFDNTNPATGGSNMYYISVWDSSADNHLTAGYLKATEYLNDNTSISDEGLFGRSSALDKVEDDGRKSIQFIASASNNTWRANTIYFKVTPNQASSKGTFGMMIGY